MIISPRPGPCAWWDQFLQREWATDQFLSPRDAGFLSDPRVPPWNLMMSEIKGLGDDLDSTSTPSFNVGTAEAQEGEASCPGSHSRDSHLGLLAPVLCSPSLCQRCCLVIQLWRWKHPSGPSNDRTPGTVTGGEGALRIHPENDLWRRSMSSGGRSVREKRWQDGPLGIALELWALPG